MINAKMAMAKTIDLAREHGLHNISSDTPNLDFDHLIDMYNEADLKDLSFHEEPLSYGKLCRWLGWMQAAVHSQSQGEITLEMLKEINRSCKEKE
jgi:hypothetical protein